MGHQADMSARWQPLRTGRPAARRAYRSSMSANLGAFLARSCADHSARPYAGTTSSPRRRRMTLAPSSISAPYGRCARRIAQGRRTGARRSRSPRRVARHPGADRPVRSDAFFWRLRAAGQHPSRLAATIPIASSTSSSGAAKSTTWSSPQPVHDLRLQLRVALWAWQANAGGEPSTWSRCRSLLPRRCASQPDHFGALAVGGRPDASWLCCRLFCVITIASSISRRSPFARLQVAPARMVSMLMGLWLRRALPATSSPAGSAALEHHGQNMFFLMIAGIA